MNPTLKQTAESQRLLLELLRLGLARIEHSTNEFCFKGMRYSIANSDWHRMAEVIGIGRIRDAIFLAKNRAAAEPQQ